MVNVVRFGLLGPLLVEHNGHQLTLPSPKQRTLLAALLARPNQVVPVGELADIVWNRLPPASAVTTLRTHVKRLRRCLGQLGPDRITTSSAGYLVRIEDAAELDIAAFTDGIHRGHSCMLDNDWATAVGELRTALGLWRGTPLSDVTGDYFGAAMIPDLRRIRSQAEEWYVEATLATYGVTESAGSRTYRFVLPIR
jgi:two-component SAPR family response regulator